MSDSSHLLDLQYPLYLDVPMMISFLAAIEDGVAYEENVHRRAGRRRSIGAEASGGIALPSLLGLLPFDLRGRLTGETANEESEELQLVKRHTEASLFNRLRSTLHDMGSVRLLDEETADNTDLVPGMIIEANGVVSRNPLDELLHLAERIQPFVASQSPTQQPGSQQRNQGGQQSLPRGQRNQRRSDAPRQTTPNGTADWPNKPDVFTIMKWVREDLDSSDMTDIVLQVAHPVFPSCILTLSKDFGTGRTIDSLLGAEVTVLGKVSGVIRDGEPVSLLRRSLLGYMPPQEREMAFGNLGSNPMFGGMVQHLEIEPPLLQVIPLSIFV